MNTSVPETEPASEAIRPANQNESAGKCDLPTINVCHFETALPNPVCIARYTSPFFDIPHLKVLAPSPELLVRWREPDKSDESWRLYTRQYWSEIEYRFTSHPQCYRIPVALCVNMIEAASLQQLV